MQGNGAEMLRLAAWRLCEVGLVPSMLVHDGILFELDNEEQVEQAKEIMRWAGREVCNGFEIGVDVDQKLDRGARYRDKREGAQRCGRRSWTRSRASGLSRRTMSRYVTRHGRHFEVRRPREGGAAGAPEACAGRDVRPDTAPAPAWSSSGTSMGQPG